MGKRLETDTELGMKQNKNTVFMISVCLLFILLKIVWAVMERNEDNIYIHISIYIYVHFVHCVKNCVNRKSWRYRLIIASDQRVKIKWKTKQTKKNPSRIVLFILFGCLVFWMPECLAILCIWLLYYLFFRCRKLWNDETKSSEHNVNFG